MSKELEGIPANVQKKAASYREVKKDFENAKSHLPQTIVHTPAFGIIGLPFGGFYDNARDNYLQTLEAGLKKIDEIADKLNKTATAIELADKNSEIQITMTE
ncbi:excreted virulence factor EspC (type VII ESX diderm) [Actinomadura pelletieri DSM 43383]|uniref:Excreted virulence factor EspC (Type VII ESX diderm) n=1 Tax=Actinomadura pelletieri DSM 43383 TaxID=1120940 RepID=A0A495QGW8_9ACTN|nr:hypothetical protein [Actinomadura pelletieri]RKS71115.1 excreted virulence factor EspC (type VII ESX diderm) [Actinomadura pelletieri DSM 43383]